MASTGVLGPIDGVPFPTPIGVDDGSPLQSYTFDGANLLWWRFTAPAAGLYAFSTYRSTYAGSNDAGHPYADMFTITVAGTADVVLLSNVYVVDDAAVPTLRRYQVLDCSAGAVVDFGLLGVSDLTTFASPVELALDCIGAAELINIGDPEPNTNLLEVVASPGLGGFSSLTPSLLVIALGNAASPGNPGLIAPTGTPAPDHSHEGTDRIPVSLWVQDVDAPDGYDVLIAGAARSVALELPDGLTLDDTTLGGAFIQEAAFTESPGSFGQAWTLTPAAGWPSSSTVAPGHWDWSPSGGPDPFTVQGRGLVFIAGWHNPPVEPTLVSAGTITKVFGDGDGEHWLHVYALTDITETPLVRVPPQVPTFDWPPPGGGVDYNLSGVLVGAAAPTAVPWTPVYALVLQTFDGQVSVVRMYPRDDGLGMSSAPRIHPRPKSQRVIGRYP